MSTAKPRNPDALLVENLESDLAFAELHAFQRGQAIEALKAGIVCALRELEGEGRYINDFRQREAIGILRIALATATKIEEDACSVFQEEEKQPEIGSIFEN